MPRTDVPTVVTPRALADAERVLGERCGLALTPGQRRALGHAVREAARAVGATDEVLLGRVLRGDEAALEALVARAVVGETSFWRHPAQLDALRQLVPALGAARLDLWSAGCASGEEAYSLAMLLAELGRGGDRVVATDVSADALAQARAARYGHWSARRLPPELRARWLRAVGHELEVAPAIRERVELSRHNLVTDPAPGAFHVVVCRNVVIHFDPPTAAEVMHRLLAAVRPGGLLVLGPVELPLAAPLAAEWVEACGATLLRRPAAVDDAPAPAPGPLYCGAREAARAGAPDAEKLARTAAAAEGGPEPWLLAAQLAEARGAPEVAVAALRRALAADPALPVAYAALAALLARLGKPGLARLARADALAALAGMDDAAPLRAVEPISAGALRRALSAGGPGS
jgi:chemotaxis protein methyltransferase CheR